MSNIKTELDCLNSATQNYAQNVQDLDLIINEKIINSVDTKNTSVENIKDNFEKVRLIY